jgi:hypothetical protein
VEPEPQKGSTTRPPGRENDWMSGVKDTQRLVRRGRSLRNTAWIGSQLCIQERKVKR